MQLKRKRSESELSTSTTSTFNSPPRIASFSPQLADMSSMDIHGFTFTPYSPASPLSHFGSKNLQLSHVPGRTMKRLRDNRPSEHEVHQRTLDMLYAAQRRQAQGTCTAGHQQHHVPTAPQPGPPSSSSLSSQQTNLHSFWNLPTRPSALPAAGLPPTNMDTPTDCEDCGQKLYGVDETMAMDVDNTPDTQVTSCGGCGKHVCSHCSITNLDEQRRCLGCAGTTSRAGSGIRSTVPWTGGMSSWLC